MDHHVVRMAHSKPILFLITEQGIEKYIHSLAFSNTIPTYDDLVNGPMSRALTETFHIKDVDEATFRRFSDWVYTGDYVNPLPDEMQPEVTKHVDKDSSTDLSQLGLNLTVIDSSVSFNGKEIVKSAPISSLDGPNANPMPAWLQEAKEFGRNFYVMKYYVDPFQMTRRSYPRNGEFEFESNQLKQKEDFSAVFLGHARVHAFARKWQIENLKAVALRKLHSTLMVYSLSERDATPEPEGEKVAMEAIVNLIRFVYDVDNRIALPLADDEMGLREVVLRYVVYRHVMITSSASFQRFVDEEEAGRVFHQDLVRVMT